jgi:hypothetical protein
MGEEFGAPAGGDAGSVQYVLRAVRDAVQRPQPRAGGQEPIRLLRLRQRHRVGRGREAEQGGIVAADAVEVYPRQTYRAELPAGDPGRQMPHGRKGNILIGFG